MKKMKWMTMISVVVVILWLSAFMGVGAAYTSVSGFTYPLREWSVVCGFNVPCADDNHLGLDLRAGAGTPVYSPYNGYVKEAQRHNGYGGTVIIEVYTGVEYITIVIGHLRPTDLKAKVGEIKQGDLLGYIGTRAENGGYGEHLHIGVRKGQYASYTYKCGSDNEWTYAGYTDCPSMVLPNWHNPEEFFVKTAINLRQSIPHNGQLIANVFGSQAGSIRWYRNPPASPIAGEIISTGDGKGMSKNVYVQHYDKEICGTDSNTNYYGSIVYDTLGGARTAYIVGWQQRCGWIGTDKVRRGGWELSGGPDSVNLRNPITNSYWYPRGTLNYPNGCWRQDFQMGWLCYEKRYGYDKDDRDNALNSVAPGVYDPWGRIFSDVRRWDAATSYAFAEAYERNGAAVNLGSTYDDGGTVFVHNWIINSSTILIQNFSGGSFGSSAIIYNPSNGNAYNVRTGFWEYYKNNSGPSLLGPPKEDEHVNSAAQPCAHISCQKFEKGELWWNGATIVAYVPSIYNIGGSDTPPPNTSAPAPPAGLRIQ